MAMAYSKNEIPNLDRDTNYLQNQKQENYNSKNYMNFTQIPKGIKEKLNLPIKNSTYLKKMINKKSQQSNQQVNKMNQRSNYDSNVFPLYNNNPNNFKRSYSNNDSKKATGIENNNKYENDYNYNKNNEKNDNENKNNNDFSNLNLGANCNSMNNSNKNAKNNNLNNIYCSNSASKKGNSTKNLIATSFINNNTKNNNNNNNINNSSRSKSNGRSNKQIIKNPMMNLIKTYTTGNSVARENPATYRKYRAQTKSTDKLYQNTTKYPVHINLNDSAVADYTYNNTNEGFNRASAAKADPYAVNDVNVNLSKYNDYEYYHNLSLQPLEKNFNSSKSLNNNNNNNYNYNNNNGFVNSNKKENSLNPKMKKSFDVLSDILDSHFTVNTPNHPKINLAAAAAAENDMRNGDSKLNLSAYNSKNNNNNLHSPNFNYINNNNNNNYKNEINNTKYNNNQNLNMSLNKENLSGHDFYKDKIYMQNEDQITKLSINLSYLGENAPENYLEALEHIMTILDPIFDRLSLTQKLEKFLENTEDHRRTIRLGSLVGLYVMLRKFQIEDEFKVLILEKIVSLLHNYETHEELFLVACLEIAGI